MFLEIIKPDSELFKGEVTSVRVPGSQESGSFELLQDHMAIVSTLKSGTVHVIDANNEALSFEVAGGVIEMSKNKITLLAD